MGEGLIAGEVVKATDWAYPLVTLVATGIALYISRSTIDSIASGLMFLFGKKFHVGMQFYWKGREAKLVHLSVLRMQLYMYDRDTVIFVPNEVMRKAEIEIPADLNVFKERKRWKAVEETLEAIQDELKLLRGEKEE